jgi:hypothetical protein
MKRATLVLIVLPSITLGIESLWWIVGPGLWPPDDVTLSEAAATRNNGEALRLMALGADPNQPSHVRDGLLTSGYDVIVTPLEAAVGAQRADTLRMLLANGAVIDDRNRAVLQCYERQRRDADVRAVLQAPPGEPDCTGVRLPVERAQ